MGRTKEEVRVALADVEIREKGRAEEVHRAGLQDVRFLERTLAKLRVEDDNQTEFLKKQTSQLVSDKIKLQQHVISLTSRVNNTAMDVCEHDSAVDYDNKEVSPPAS